MDEDVEDEDPKQQVIEDKIQCMLIMQFAMSG